LRPLTRTLRQPLRWFYHRSPVLKHDTHPSWKARLLPLLHSTFVGDHPSDFLIYKNQLKFRSRGSVMSTQAYYVGEVEYHLVQYVAAQIRPGFVMLDVGAHHGVFTMVAAFELKKRGWKGLIHSFEPDPGNFSLLEYNVRQNDLASYVVLHPEAVGDTKGHLEMVFDAGDNSGNCLVKTIASTSPLDQAATVRHVPVTTLDSWLDNLPALNLIKMDIQGAEPLALEGGRNLIARFRPVIVIEAVPGWHGTEQIQRKLIEYRYRIFGADKKGRLCPPDSKEAFVSWDWVAIPEEQSPVKT